MSRTGISGSGESGSHRDCPEKATAYQAERGGPDRGTIWPKWKTMRLEPKKGNSLPMSSIWPKSGSKSRPKFPARRPKPIGEPKIIARQKREKA